MKPLPGHWRGTSDPKLSFQSGLAVHRCFLLDLSLLNQVVKNLPANAGGVRDTGSIPGSGRLSGGGHGNSLQYPCLENPLDRGAWWATVCRVAESQTQLKQLGMPPRRLPFFWKVANAERDCVIMGRLLELLCALIFPHLYEGNSDSTYPWGIAMIKLVNIHKVFKTILANV